LNIPVRVLIKLAELYNTSIDYIVGHTDERRPYPHALQRQTGAL
jgi:hypothetical protein